MIMRARVLNDGNVMDVACDEQGRLSIGGVTLEGNVAIDLTSTNTLLQDIRDTLDPASGNFVVQIDPAVAVRIDDSTPLDVNLESLAAIFNAGIPVRIDNVDSDIDFRVVIESLDSSAFPNGLNVNLNAINTTLFPNGIPVDLQGATDLTVTATIDQDPGDPPLRVTLEGTTPGSSLSVSIDDFNVPLPGLPVYLDAASSPLRVVFDSLQSVDITGAIELDPTQFGTLNTNIDNLDTLLTGNQYNVGGVTGQRVIIHDADGVLSDANPLRTRTQLLDSTGTLHDATNRIQVSSRLLDAANAAFGVSANPIFTTGSLRDSAGALITTSNRLPTTTRLIDAAAADTGVAANPLYITGSLRDSTGALITNANPLPTSASVTFPTTLTNQIGRVADDDTTIGAPDSSLGLVALQYSKEQGVDRWRANIHGLQDLENSLTLHTKTKGAIAQYVSGTNVTVYGIERANTLRKTNPVQSLMTARVIPVGNFVGGLELNYDDLTTPGLNALNMNTFGELLVGGRLQTLLHTGSFTLTSIAGGPTEVNGAKPYIGSLTNGAVPINYATGFIILQVTKLTYSETGSSALNFALQFNNHPDPSAVLFNNYWFSTVEFSPGISTAAPAQIYGSFGIGSKGNYLKAPVLGRWVRPIIWTTGPIDGGSAFDITLMHSNV